MIKNILIILLLGITLVAGCTQLPPNDNDFQEKELSFDTVDKDVNSIIQERAQKVIQNSEDFLELWNEIGSLKMLEEIDFSKYTVIAVFQGQQPTGGYSIEINKVKETKDKIQVYIIETFPDPNDVVTQALTSPYHIISIAKTNKEIEFNNLAQNGDKPPLPPEETEKSWVDELIDKELKGTEDPSASLSKCEYKNKIYYSLIRPCCDQFTELFDESGNSICLPSGGFDGKGSGDCPDFVKQISNCEVIWKPSISNENPKNIELNKEFTLEVGETAILKEDDLRIKFLEVVEDSRCPIGAQCIRGGSVRIKIDARYDNEKNLGIYEVEIGDNNDINSYVEVIPQKYRDELSSPIAHRIEFIKVNAEKESDERLDLEVYSVTFKVTEAFTL